MNRRMNAIPRGMRALTVVHLALRVSLKTVHIAVEQGLWRSENSMRLTAVRKVHPS
jgi:hypothetical protein